MSSFFAIILEWALARFASWGLVEVKKEVTLFEEKEKIKNDTEKAKDAKTDEDRANAVSSTARDIL